MSSCTGLTVRGLVASDEARWRVLWDGYNEFYGRAGPTSLDPIITQATWSRLLDDSEPMQGLVAIYGGQLAGLAHYLYHRSTIAIAPVCYLQDLYTLPSARGNGIGRVLIDAVIADALRAGAPRLYWHTYESNRVARRLYDQVAERPEVVMYRKAL